MPKINNVCLIDAQPLIINAFKDMGCAVLCLRTTAEPYFDLAQALGENDFMPDLVMQTEILANRSVVTGLDTVDCPTIFWAVDPHLNAYWHSAYARLFDMACSTQRGWISRIAQQGAVDVRWLPMFGRQEPWVEMTERGHALAFVGRVSDQRPARKWMVEFLEEKGRESDIAIEHSLKYEEMMGLYRDSRIIPNESIFGEVNFRLFEAASCGCLVLSQDLGDEQASLFEPGREFDTYDNIVELDEKLGMYLKNERLVQTMGRAAYERVQAEHLPKHRAERLVEFACDVSKNRVSDKNAAKWMALTSVSMWESGVLSLPTQEVLAQLSALDQDADIAAAVLRVQARANMTGLMEDNIKTILGAQLYGESLDLNLAGSMASLRLGHWDGAKAFWYRHLQTTGARPSEPPRDKIQLLTFWAKELKRHDRVVRAGFSFDAERHLSCVAVECLMAILNDEPEHLPTLRLLDAMLKPITGLEQARVGFLSILTLHERKDWRLALEIGLANLKSYRLVSGMEELHLAREIAREQGQEAMFRKALAIRDKSGMLAARLGD